jgi:glycosyltransferase involved in cell wall biosynthesis
MKPEISVIICTHNPRRDYLDRVLEALRGQSFSMDRWELLLIDNKSAEPLADRVDLRWHPAGRVVREEELGLTQARVRGIRESCGDLLVFVDDDNVLRQDYLERAVKLSDEWPKLGAWSGRVVPEYEAEPAGELKPYLWMLCIRPIEKDCWGNEGSFDSTPWGAGMCVRKCVADRYQDDIRNDDFRASLDRRGGNLGSTGDIDLALTSHSLGLGTGVFRALEIVHLIPNGRVQESYLLLLIEDTEAGSVLYNQARGLRKTSQNSRIDRLVAEYKFLRAPRLQKLIERAIRRGRQRGEKALALVQGI